MERAKSWLPALAASDLNPLTFGRCAGQAGSCLGGQRAQAARQRARRGWDVLPPQAGAVLAPAALRALLAQTVQEQRSSNSERATRSPHVQCPGALSLPFLWLLV